MPYVFLRTERLEDGARRIAREGLYLAIASLEGSPGGTPSRVAERVAEAPDEQVHDARKALKRLRALVRFVRGAVGESTYRATNAALADAAKGVSDARDSAVMIETFARLAQGAAEANAIAQSLRRTRTASQKNEGRDRERAVAILRAEIPKVEAWVFREDGFAALSDGAIAAYRGARRKLRGARDGVALHELRKRTKDVQYQTQLLHDVWPAAMKAWGKALDELGDRLGEDHDLFLLQERLATKPEGARFIERAEIRRRELVEESLPIAARIFAEKPDAYAARLEAWFGAWHAAS